MIGLLEESMPDVTFHTVELGEDVENPLDAVLDQLPAEPEGPVMVLGLERSNPSTAETRPVLYALNLGRAEWAERLSQPVVFWIPEYFLGLMGREAPDFLDWRSDTLHFSIQDGQELTPLFTATWRSVTGTGDLSEVQRRRRVKELQSRLATLPESVEPYQLKTRVEWLSELANHFFILGDRIAAEQALTAADQLLRGLETEAAEFYRASVALRRGRLSAARGEIQEAANFFERAAASFEQVDRVRDHTIALGELARLKAQAGDVQEALQLHQEELQIYETLGDVRSRAATLGDIARLRAQAGDVQEALDLHQQQLQTYEKIGDARSRAVTLGDIARLKAQAGEVQEALDLHQQQLQVYETLGDVRERAVTLGDVARLKAQAGDVDVARELHEEWLEVNRKLGDLGGIGAALHDLAQLDLAEDKPQDALSRLMEAWKISHQIGRVDAIAAVGNALGQLLAAFGKKYEAEQVLAQSETAFRKLELEAQADQVQALREGLGGGGGE